MKMRDAGFTLIELLIVVAILAILAAIAGPAIMDYVQHSKQQSAAAGQAPAAQTTGTQVLQAPDMPAEKAD
jgi:prepilin-type N-terminal cleavage/methylation domain-containing protein